MSKGDDTLYSIGTVAEDFSFNERVAEVFDDMLSRSIPYYRSEYPLHRYALSPHSARRRYVIISIFIDDSKNPLVYRYTKQYLTIINSRNPYYV